MEMTLPTPLEDPPEAEQISSGWTLKKLSVRHKEAASLLAQGCRRQEIAAITQFTPEYISFLTRQPLFREYVAEMGRFSEERLKALFDETVEVISDTLRNGTEEGRLKAARLQMEATGRIGRERAAKSGEGEDEGLNALADRLVQLMRKTRTDHGQQATVEGTFTDITDSEQLHSARPGTSGASEDAQIAARPDPATDTLPPKNQGRRLTDAAPAAQP